MRIMVNGKNVDYNADIITYDDIMELVQANMRHMYTVVYDRLYESSCSGHIRPGGNVLVSLGMIINAFVTGH